MTPRGWLLLSWIVVGAAVLVVHGVVVVQVFRARALPRRRRLWALVPVAAPVMAWIVGRRVSPIAWGVLVLTYVALRAVEGI